MAIIEIGCTDTKNTTLSHSVACYELINKLSTVYNTFYISGYHTAESIITNMMQMLGWVGLAYPLVHCANSMR